MMEMVKRRPGRPSPFWGWARALELWRLIGVNWIVGFVVFAPALLVVRATVFRALSALPPEPGAIPPGDIGLIIVEACRPVLAPLALASVSGFVMLWAWTVLWHAGVVAWQVWTGGRRVRLGEVLGLGLVAWWRYARLSLTALAAFTLMGFALWLPLSSAIQSAYNGMNEERAMVLAAVGMVTTKLVAIVVWLATLHGAWLLGLPEHRSALLTWFRGLWSAIRTPLSSVATWLVWLVPAWLAAVVPLVLGFRYEGLRGTLLLMAIGLLAGLLRSLCWVGLFGSFAPVTGLVGGIAEEALGERNDDGPLDVEMTEPSDPGLRISDRGMDQPFVESARTR